MVGKHSFATFLPDFNVLLGKKIIDWNENETGIEIVVDDGKCYTFELINQFAFFAVRFLRFQHIKGKVIHKIELNRENQLYIEAEEEYALVNVHWLNEDTFRVDIHSNGRELLISIENEEEHDVDLLYFIHEGEWMLSSYFLDTHSAFIQIIIKKYDFLTHPKTRLKIITQ